MGRTAHSTYAFARATLQVQRGVYVGRCGWSGQSGPHAAHEVVGCRSLVERTVSELGTLDILANNAAYQLKREGIEQIPDGEWEQTFRTNVRCPQ